MAQEQGPAGVDLRKELENLNSEQLNDFIVKELKVRVSADAEKLLVNDAQASLVSVIALTWAT